MKTLVIGIARSGVASAKLLKNLGDQVTVQDNRTREKVANIADELEKLNIELKLGSNIDVKLFDRIVISPGVPIDIPMLTEARSLNIPVIGEIELAYLNTPCKIAAITGTNGKTTTTALTGEIFKVFNKNTKVLGNIGIPFTEEVQNLTEESFVVAEISSFQLETTFTFKPHIAAILNLTPDHLDRHKTLENYFDAKAKIFENQNTDDYCIFNYDDIECRKYAEKCQSTVLFFSRKSEVKGAFCKDNIIYIKDDIKIYEVINTNELNLIGNHNIENVLAATAIAFFAKVPLEIIKNVLSEFTLNEEHRIEYVETINGVDFYNDSKATNPDAAIKGIEAMSKPVILIGGGSNKGYEFDNWVQSFTGKVKFLVAIGETSEIIEKSLNKFGFEQYILASTFEEAITVAYKNSNKGDCVLLSPACASFDMFANYEERGRIFKKLVHELRG